MIHVRAFPARIAAAIVLAAAAFAIPAAAAADTAPQGATVSMTDSGFSPAVVTIPVGGSVTWKNDGSGVHTATSVGGGPSTFNTAGVGGGQTATVAFNTPGQYFYTSATDCLNNVNNPNFPCTVSYLVTVVPAGTPLPPPSVAPAPPAPSSPSPSIAPIPAGPVGSATVTITDGGMVPPSVTIALNGSVTWVNKGADVHTATTNADNIANSMPPFDTGGLGPGQSASIGFPTPGTYTYLSSPDCLSKSNPGAFNCGPYTVIVGPNPVPAAESAPGPAPTPVNVPGANVTVTIDDVNGFQPNDISIKVGQTVAWKVTGNATHSVVINQNPTPDTAVPWWLPYKLPSVGGVFFDSGGLSPQQSFSYTFNTPGTFPYHSSTEPIYQQNNTNCGCTLITYQFFGTVTVSQ